MPTRFIVKQNTMQTRNCQRLYGNCTYLLNSGFCNRRAICREDGRSLCGAHREALRQSGPCPICMEEMSVPAERTQMECCRQWIHRDCIREATDHGCSTCPMCRRVQDCNSGKKYILTPLLVTAGMRSSWISS
jgi:hypothetical protein